MMMIIMNMMIDEYDDYDDDLTHGPTQPYIGDLAAADDDDEECFLKIMYISLL